MNDKQTSNWNRVFFWKKLIYLIRGDYGKAANLHSSLRFLTHLLFRYYGIKNLYFAVITGCLRIARESIFTGLNNFKIWTISDEYFAEYFGFTDCEVREMMRYYEVEDRYADVKEWYDGYWFGSAHVYCPWDVINQCDKLRVRKDSPMESHWENSSSNPIIKDMIEGATEVTKAEIETLISGGCVEKPIIPELTYTDLDSEDRAIRETYLWSVLYAAGYLTDLSRTDFADIQNKKECGGNRQWQRRFLKNWAANTNGKEIT